MTVSTGARVGAWRSALFVSQGPEAISRLVMAVPKAARLLPRPLLDGLVAMTERVARQLDADSGGSVVR